jgi:hypothetical protein
MMIPVIESFCYFMMASLYQLESEPPPPKSEPPL